MNTETSILNTSSIINQRYKIIKNISSGGMGDIYLAFDLFLEKKIILKTIKKELLDQENKKKYQETFLYFKNEYKIIKSLSHPFLVKVYDFTTTDDFSYFTMQYVDGLNLDKFIEQTNLTIKEKIKLFIKILRTLEFLHDRNIIFGDLKLDNIIIKNNTTPIIIDFGLAKTFKDVIINKNTTFQGTINYGAPELFKKLHIDHKIDIFAAGIILLNLFNIKSINYKSTFSNAVDLAFNKKMFDNFISESVRNINNENIRKIILKMTAYNTEKRYQNISNTIDDILKIFPIENKVERIELLRSYSKIKISNYLEKYEVKLNAFLENSSDNFFHIIGTSEYSKSSLLRSFQINIDISTKKYLYLDCLNFTNNNSLGPLKNYIKESLKNLTKQQFYRNQKIISFLFENKLDNIEDEKLLLLYSSKLLYDILKESNSLIILHNYSKSKNEIFKKIITHFIDFSKIKKIKFKIILDSEIIDNNSIVNNKNHLEMMPLNNSEITSYLIDIFGKKGKNLQELAKSIIVNTNKYPGEIRELLTHFINREYLIKKNNQWIFLFNKQTNNDHFKKDKYFGEKLNRLLLVPEITFILKYLYYLENSIAFTLQNFLNIIPIPKKNCLKNIELLEENDIIAIFNHRNYIQINFTAAEYKKIISIILTETEINQINKTIIKFIETNYSLIDTTILEKLIPLYTNCNNDDKVIESLEKLLPLYQKSFQLIKTKIIINKLTFYYEKTNEKIKLLKLQSLIAHIALNSGDWNISLNLYKFLLKKIKKDEIGTSVRIDIYANLSFLYTKMSDFSKALKYAEKARKLAKENNNQKELHRAYGLLGVTYNRMGEHNKALKYHQKRLKYALKNNDLLTAGKTYNNIAVIYTLTQQYEKALINVKRFYKIVKKNAHKYLEIVALGNLGAVYDYTHKYEKAFKFYHLQLKTAKEFNVKNSIEISLGNLSLICLKFSKWDKVFKYNTEALNIAVNMNNIPEIIQSNIGLSLFYLHENNFNKSLFYCNKALLANKKSKNQKLIFLIIKQKSEIFKKANKRSKMIAILKTGEKYYKKYKLKNEYSLKFQIYYLCNIELFSNVDNLNIDIKKIKRFINELKDSIFQDLLKLFYFSCFKTIMEKKLLSGSKIDELKYFFYQKSLHLYKQEYKLNKNPKHKTYIDELENIKLLKQINHK